MTVRELAQLTWQEAGGTDRDRTVVVLPVGALEAHGPHLPLATDVWIAEAMARAGADKLAARGMDVLLLPALAYTTAPFAADFPGTVSIDPAAVTVQIAGLIESLARHDFEVLALANAHLDPSHITALQSAVDAARQSKRMRIVFPDVTQKPWAQRLTAEFKSGACHAGRYETSEAGGPRAYFGYPSEATPEEGRTTIAALGAILEEAVMIELARSVG